MESTLLRRACRHAALAVASLPTVLLAQLAPADYSSRRDTLAARIGDGIVVAFGGRTPISDF